MCEFAIRLRSDRLKTHFFLTSFTFAFLSRRSECHHKCQSRLKLTQDREMYISHSRMTKNKRINEYIEPQSNFNQSQSTLHMDE